VITTLKSVIAETPRRADSAERTCLQVLVHPETYAWLSSIAGEHAIGGALDVMAEIHRAIEKAANPLGEIIA
jgi:hypothetical protein